MRRRVFLAASGIGVCSAALAVRRWRMRLSTSTVMFHSLPVEDACARIAALGFEGVDFWQGEYFKCKHLDEVAGRLGADGLKKLLAKHRLEIAAFTCYLGIPHQSYSSILGAVGRGKGVLIRESEFYKRDGGRVVGVPKDAHELMERMGALFETLKPALELADRNGYRIAIENHTNALLNSVDSFKAFLELANHPRLGIALAPYHLQMDGISVEDVIALAGKRIFFVYAWQHEPGSKQLPGIGSADFTPWLQALAKFQYPDYVNPFMHGPLGKDSPEAEPSPDDMSEAVEQSRRYLLECRAKFT